MKDRQTSDVEVSNSSATTRGAGGALTRRKLMGASVLGAGLLGASASPLGARPKDPAQTHGVGRVIDAHIHLWKLPRSAPPMSDFSTYPEQLPLPVPYMNRDRLMADYDARVGGPKVDKVVLIEASVGVTPDHLIQSNLWLLQTAATEGKILSVTGKLDVTQGTGSFVQQLDFLMSNAHKKLVGLRVGGLFLTGTPAAFANLQPNVLNNFAIMVQRGLQIDTLGTPGAVLAQIGAAVPGLVIVMDHFAGKPSTFLVEDSWQADMQAAASYPNLNIKVSDVHKQSAFAATGQPAGLAQFQPVADPEPYEPHLEFLWRTFGEDRLIFGTNWPVADAGGAFVDSIDLQISIMEDFLADKYVSGRDKVMYQNALRVYGPRK